MPAMAPWSGPRTAGVWEIPTNEELEWIAATPRGDRQRDSAAGATEDAAVGRNASSS